MNIFLSDIQPSNNRLLSQAPLQLSNIMDFSCSPLKEIHRDEWLSPVSFNVLSAVLHVAEPLGPVLHQELLDQVLRHGVDVPGPVDLAAEDLLVDPEGIVVEEGRISSQHLVDEYAQGPPVDCLVVTLREGLEILSLSSTLVTLDWMISGARYSGVPQRVQVRSLIRLANPKSVIFKCPSLQHENTETQRSGN